MWRTIDKCVKEGNVQLVMKLGMGMGGHLFLPMAFFARVVCFLARSLMAS